MEIYKNTTKENINGEFWKDVVGYEGIFCVSNLGRVKSFKTLKVLKQALDKRGYCRVANIKPCTVHRLVAMAFIPNYQNKRTVNHIDCSKTNNNLSNLEWATDKENKKHAIDNGLAVICKNGFGIDHHLSKPVIQYTLGGNIVKEWECGEETKNYGYNPLCVSRCCREKQNHHKGYIWRYKK